ncbi:amidase signature enzyme [Astrocystis sublimbata]|nr:amidase signature enzyme [Astrocystis sublimbata]
MSAYARHTLPRAASAHRAVATQWLASRLLVRSLHHQPARAANFTAIDGSDVQHDAGDGFVPNINAKKSFAPNVNNKKIRLAIKDNIAAPGLPTTCASQILADTTIPFAATIVQQLLRQPGVEIVGKAGMDEFGMGTHSTTSFFETVRNAHPLEAYSAGGSSGGSAVAVKEGTADLALGTDTGGSVRMPAAYTGTVGFKPSYGMLSRHGVVPYANSLDTVGLMARTVTPIREALIDGGLYAEPDTLDPTSIPAAARARCTAAREFPEKHEYSPHEREGDEHGPFKGLTFGFPLEYNIAELSPRIRVGWLHALKKIRRLGGRVVPVSLPLTRSALSAYYVIAPAEASSNLAKYDGIRYGFRDTTGGNPSDAGHGVLYARTRGAGFGAEVKRRILLGAYSLSSEAIDNYFLKAQQVRRLVRQDFQAVFKLEHPLTDDGKRFEMSKMEEGVQLDSKLGPAQVDFLVSPTAPTPPPDLRTVAKQTPLDAYMNDVFTVPASLAGLPAISIPMDLPIDPLSEKEKLLHFGGLQIIGQYWDDARVLAVAERLSGEVYSHLPDEGNATVE